MSTGWTKYDPELGVGTPVEFPDEDLLFFDVEVCVLDGQLPTMAIALSPTAWLACCFVQVSNYRFLGIHGAATGLLMVLKFPKLRD